MPEENNGVLVDHFSFVWRKLDIPIFNVSVAKKRNIFEHHISKNAANIQKNGGNFN
jgi:hypothetical protein